MAKEKQSDDDLLAQMEAEESVSQLAKRLEALEAKTTGQSVTERTFVSPVGKGSKTFRVVSKNATAPFRSAIVKECCDESEAVRTVFAEYQLQETHGVRCEVQPV